MQEHKIYIVTSNYVEVTPENSLDTNIEGVYDSEMFSVNSILAKLEEDLKGQKYQLTMYGDNDGINKVTIDVIQSNDEVIKTYLITSRNVMFHSNC